LSKACKTKNSSGAANLNEYLARARGKPFDWGTHDCVQFVRGAAEVQTGASFPLPEYASLRGALALCKSISLVAELDKLFDRCEHVPPVGSIVAVHDTERESVGYRLGVVVSDKAAFVSPSGLVFAKLRPETDLYWIVK
jgi:hypothetical protein